MDEAKLKELGLTDEQLNAVKDMFKTAEDELESKISKAVQEKEDELKGTFDTEIEGYKNQLLEKDVEYATRDIISKYKFSSEFAKEMALQKLKEQKLEYKDGKLVGADKFMEQMQKDNATAFAQEVASPVIVSAGGSSSAGGTNIDGVEAAFREINPGLKK